MSKVYELSDEPELQQLKRWPLCVYNKMVTVCSPCVALSPRTKLIIQMAKMINLHTRHLHVEIHLPPAARRLGSSQLVSASRKTSSVNSSTTRLCCSFQQDQRPQDGNFGVVKSAQQRFHRVLIVKDRHKSRSWAFWPKRDYPHLSPPHLPCPGACQICGFIVTQQRLCDKAEWGILSWQFCMQSGFIGSCVGN